MNVVYLDYAATTPVDPRVAAVMAECLTLDGTFGNPASNHAYGVAARARVEKARAQVAALIHADAQAIIWTSGATESNNLALLGAARFHVASGRHLITTRTEHKSVLDPCKQLEKEGFEVTYLKPDREGVVDVADVAAALRPATTLVSIMHVNNEIGVVQDVGAIGRLCRERGVLFHVDAAQSAGKMPIDVEAQCIDLMSLTAHKLYGPKGIGALYVRPRPRVGLVPLLFGGGHEQGLRSGTLATHQVAGFGLACEIAAGEMESSASRLERLRQRLLDGLVPLGGVLCNGHPRSRVTHILNLSFGGVEGESLLHGLRELAVSSGSACNSATREASYVLRALGRSDAEAQAALRFSLGRFSTDSDVEMAIAAVTREVTRLRQLSPATPDTWGSSEAEATRVAGEAGSIASGTWVRFALEFDGARVTDARYKVYGCPHTVAATAWFADRLRGRRLDEVLAAGVTEAAQQLTVPVEKLGRLLVIEDALRECQRRVSRTV
jgi:cysteine desulfurase